MVTPVAAAIAVGSAVVTAGSAASAVPGGLLGLLQALVPFLGARRRRPSLGRVVDADAFVPIGGISIAVLDVGGKPRERLASRSDGTFAAFLPRGAYRLSIQEAEYVLAERPGVPLFPGERLYAGGIFPVESAEELTPLVVALRRRDGRRRQGAPRLLRRFAERLRILQAQLALPVLLVGAFANSVTLFLAPSALLVGFEMLYGVLLGMELLLSRKLRRAVGRVRDAIRKAPVALAVVRLLDAERRLVGTKVTSPRGQFLLMPPPGDYTLQVIHAAYRPYTKEHVVIRPGAAGPARVTADLQPRAASPTL